MLDTYESIMEASSDSHMFFKLSKWQRDGGFTSKADIEYPEPTAGYIYIYTEVDKWADYFTKLATPKCLPEFDDDHKQEAQRP